VSRRVERSGGDDEVEFVAAGRLGKASGISGRLRLSPSLASAESVLPGKDVLIGGDPVRGAIDRQGPKYRVESVTGTDGSLLVKLEGLEDRSVAESLTGSFIYIAVADLPRLSDEDYYLYRLCRMEARSESGDRIGRIKDVWEMPAHPVLVVESDSGREILIPFIRAFVREVDEEEGRVVLSGSPGLEDLS
jgi:16S rRNA processing protein RimM